MEFGSSISRNEFLKQMGFKGAALMALYTLNACESEGVSPQPLTADIVIDLSATANATLKTNGGYVVNSGVVIARYQDQYIAATLTCSHEGQRQIVFRTSEWYCTAHGARFDTSGKGLNSEGRAGLTVYATQLSGNTLTVKAS